MATARENQKEKEKTQTQLQKPYQLFTHASVVAFTTMGMVRPITLAWGDISYQPIFGNRHILNPNAIGGPCAWTLEGHGAEPAAVKK